jgi:monoamine oxidase
MQNIAKHFAGGLDIRMGAIITQIDYSNSRVQIKTASGDTYSGKAVIVTLPLGVLKRTAKQTGHVKFLPALPAANQNAIAALGMGLLDKVVLSFPRVFWGDKTLEMFGRVSTGKPGLWEEWFSLYPITGKAVLVALNSGAHAQGLAGKTDTEVVAAAMAALRKTFGSSKVPDPVGYKITHWGKDRFAFGAYSFNAKGADFTKTRTK